MSNFLGHLAAKQFSQLEVLRPRLAARFDPPAGMPGPRLQTGFDTDPAREAPSVGLAARFELPAGMPEPHLQTGFDTDPAREAPSVSLSDPGAPPLAQTAVEAPVYYRASLKRPALRAASLARNSSVSSQPASPHGEGEALTPVPVSSPVMGGSPRPGQSRPELPAQTGRQGETVSNALQARRLPPEPEPLAPRTTSLRAATEMSRLGEIPSPSGPADVPAAPARLAAHAQVSKRLEPARQARPPSEEAGAETQPETTVHITIGRIEVRAVPPPAQASRPAKPAAPKLSLDEYLNSRRGGKP